MFKLMKRRYARRYAALLLCAVLSVPMSINLNAAEPSDAVRGSDISGQAELSIQSSRASSPRVYINNSEYPGRTFLYNSTTYVGIREYSMYMGAESVDWNSAEKTAVIKADNLEIKAKYLNTYIIANGRYLWAKDGILIRDGTMYVPLRVIAKSFNCTVNWDPTCFSAFVNGGGALTPADSYYGADQVLWLSRIINAEAGNEPLLGKIAVGTVVLNRVKASGYPSTIYGVIFDMEGGVQFTPAANGTVYNTPNEESIAAAKLCLDGARVSESILFFVNERLAENTWVSDNRPFVMTIGNHNFFA